jgi:hypothetical protein
MFQDSKFFTLQQNHLPFLADQNYKSVNKIQKCFRLRDGIKYF